MIRTQCVQLEIWAKQFGGTCFDSSVVFCLPDDSKRSPDASWIATDRWIVLAFEDQKKFPPIAPDFVIELRSETDRLPALQAKMVGLIDESGTIKSGKCTAGVGRQYNGNRGKIENCTFGVHLGYSTPTFKTILDSRMYLPQDWANDPQPPKKIHPRRHRVSNQATDRPRLDPSLACQGDSSTRLDVRRTVWSR